ncbi:MULTISPECIES: hypothetical protein [unclassified Ensifer]|uniref:hypothetical protein n=1 Tax=unclassified Ensifer TaxID=2633371 RepID=UPI000812E4BC|nr:MULTISPECIES: hypothetical protein [unclassified Ensifer]OCP20582.1 hypothetical protein BC363_30030 [Ensifer sp. LC384]OCP20627.1 hypothetical protein BC361_29180 [Ensifer sp. LC54]
MRYSFEVVDAAERGLSGKRTNQTGRLEMVAAMDWLTESGAFRPVDNFRLNLLFVFSWLFDLVGFLKLTVDVCEDGGL